MILKLPMNISHHIIVTSFILSVPGYCTHSPHGPPFLPYFRTFYTKGILLSGQNEISYNLFSKLVPGRYISGPQSILSNLLLPIYCQVPSQSITSFFLIYCHAFFFASIHSPSALLHSLCTPLGPQPLRS